MRREDIAIEVVDLKGGQPMNSKPDISAVQAEPISKSLEEEISNSVRGDRLTNRLAGLKPQPDAGGEANESIGQLIEKMGATSIAEIEKLIGDLEGARNYLKAEGDRIQQEMARFAHLSDTASASVKIITESLGQWRKAPTMIMSLEPKHGNSRAPRSHETLAKNVRSRSRMGMGRPRADFLTHPCVFSLPVLRSPGLEKRISESL